MKAQHVTLAEIAATRVRLGRQAQFRTQLALTRPAPIAAPCVAWMRRLVGA